MMCAVVIGCSGAIAMSLIIRKRQVEKQRRQQVVKLKCEWNVSETEI